MPTIMAKPHLEKAILAFDPFNPPGKSHQAVFNVLGYLNQKRPFEAEPAYVLNPGNLNLSLEFSEPLESKLRQSAQKTMQERLKPFGFPGLTEPRVLVQTRSSLRESVRKLLAHAQSSGADLIVAETHARKGLARLFMGSFTETLILQSKIPVLIVNPSSKPRPIKRILFPTDFAKNAKAVFHRILALAADLDAEITILHVTPRPVEQVFQSGVYLLSGAWIPVQEYVSRDEARKSKIARDWANEASTKGVKAKTIFDPGTRGIRAAILEQAAGRKADLIAMAAQSGPTEALLIGSIARQVIREAQCPVWVARNA